MTRRNWLALQTLSPPVLMRMLDHYWRIGNSSIPALTYTKGRLVNTLAVTSEVSEHNVNEARHRGRRQIQALAIIFGRWLRITCLGLPDDSTKALAEWFASTVLERNRHTHTNHTDLVGVLLEQATVHGACDAEPQPVTSSDQLDESTGCIAAPAETSSDRLDDFTDCTDGPAETSSGQVLREHLST